jgi:hypothetical protein
MTGPEHYHEAERLISMVEKALPGGQFRHFDGDEDTRAMLAAAQVHATLAIAAANAPGRGCTHDEFNAWREATS